MNRLGITTRIPHICESSTHLDGSETPPEERRLLLDKYRLLLDGTVGVALPGISASRS